MTDSVNVLTTALLWAVVLWRLPMIRAASAERNLWSALAALASAQALNLPAIYDAFNRLTGVAYGATTAKQALVILAAAHTHRMLHGVTQRGPDGGTRHKLRPFLFAAAALSVTLVAGVAGGPATGFASDIEFYQLSPLGLAAWVAYLGYLTWAVIEFIRMCWSYGRASPAGPVRTGLFLGGVGAAYGLTHVVHKTGLLIATAYIGPAAGTADRAITVAVLGPTLLLCAVGSCFPALARESRYISTRYRSWQSLRRLYPLWRALYDATPEIALTPAPPAHRDALSFRNLNWRLVRRVIEIRDGFLAIRPYIPAEYPGLGAHSGEATSGPQSAKAQAAALEAALRAKLQGANATAGRRYPDGGGGHNLQEEVRWLEGVARARRDLVAGG